MSDPAGTRTLRMLTATGACLLLTLLPGVGSGPRIAVASSKQPTARDAANRLCAAWQRQVQRNGPFPVPDFDPDQPTADQLPAVGRHFMPVIAASESMANKLRARTDGDRRLRAFVAALDAENANARTQAEAALAGDVQGFRATLADVDALLTARSRAARVLGAPACSRM